MFGSEQIGGELSLLIMARLSKTIDIIPLLDEVLYDVPNVVLEGEIPVKVGVVEILEAIEKTAKMLLSTLEAMSRSDPYYEVTYSAYFALPEVVKTNIEYVAITGGPGCGKSTVIRKVCRMVKKTVVMVPFKRLVADYPDELCYTQHNCVLQERETRLLLVDEFTGCDMGMVFAACLNQGCSKIILWGDKKQTWLQDKEGVSFKNEQPPVYARLTSNYRNPREDVLFLNALFKDDMKPMVKDVGLCLGISVEELYGGKIRADTANLTFSRDSVNELRETYFINAITVRSSQGATYDKVSLFVFERDLNMCVNLPLLRVALSRHTQSLTIFTVHTESARDMLNTRRVKNDHLVGLDAHELSDQKSIYAKIISVLRDFIQ